MNELFIDLLIVQNNMRDIKMLVKQAHHKTKQALFSNWILLWT